jgi:hypothetical protein
VVDKVLLEVVLVALAEAAAVMMVAAHTLAVLALLVKDMLEDKELPPVLTLVAEAVPVRLVKILWLTHEGAMEA